MRKDYANDVAQKESYDKIAEKLAGVRRRLTSYVLRYLRDAYFGDYDSGGVDNKVNTNFNNFNNKVSFILVLRC